MEVEDPAKQWFYDTMCRYIEDQRKATATALAEQRQAAVETPADHGHAPIHDPQVCVSAPDRLLKCSAPAMVDAGIQEFESHVSSYIPDFSIVTSTTCSMECPSGSTGLSPSMASACSVRGLSSVVSTDKSSGKCAATTDELSPGARRLCDPIVVGWASPTSAASPHVHEQVTATATAALEILRSMPAAPSTSTTSGICSMVCRGDAADLMEINDTNVMLPISVTGRSTTTSVSSAAYKLFDRMPRCPEWSPECVLSIMVCRALYTIDEDLLRPILAPYGVKRLVINPRATTSNGSQYVTAIAELNSSDAAARARVALHGKYLFDGCCYLQVKFASPYECTSLAKSTEVVSTTARTAGDLHEDDIDIISVVSKHNPAPMLLDSTPTPMMPLRLVSEIEPVISARCSLEYPGDDTTGVTPTSAKSARSSALKPLGGAAPPTATVLVCVDGNPANASRLSDASLKHFPVLWSLFIPQRELATINKIQVTISKSTVQFMLLSDVRPLPWPSFMNGHQVGYAILLIPYSLFTCLPGRGCRKHPWPPPPSMHVCVLAATSRLNSWMDAMLAVHQWILLRCSIYVRDSFVMELILDGDDSFCLTCQFIHMDYEPMQKTFPWLSSCPVYLKLKLGAAIYRGSNPCCDHCLILCGGSSSLVAVLQVGQSGMPGVNTIVLKQAYTILLSDLNGDFFL